MTAMTQVAMTFSEKLRDLREAAGMSERALADAAGFVNESPVGVEQQSKLAICRLRFRERGRQSNGKDSLDVLTCRSEVSVGRELPLPEIHDVITKALAILW